MLLKENFSYDLPPIFKVFFTILVTTVPPQFFCTLTFLNLLFELSISVCISEAIGERYGALCRDPMYVCMCLKESVKYGQLVRVFVFYKK